MAAAFFGNRPSRIYPVRISTKASKPWYSTWTCGGGGSSCHMRTMMPKKTVRIGMACLFVATHDLVATALSVFPGERLRAEVREVEHHLAHLGSAFLVSPFEEAVAVSVDGFGDFASAAWGVSLGCRLSAKAACQGIFRRRRHTPAARSRGVCIEEVGGEGGTSWETEGRDHPTRCVTSPQGGSSRPLGAGRPPSGRSVFNSSTGRGAGAAPTGRGRLRLRCRFKAPLFPGQR